MLHVRILGVNAFRRLTKIVVCLSTSMSFELVPGIQEALRLVLTDTNVPGRKNSVMTVMIRINTVSDSVLRATSFMKFVTFSILIVERSILSVDCCALMERRSVDSMFR